MRQHPGEPRRRWFRSENEDLIVWYAPDKSILGFQLCYDVRRQERALTWRKVEGYSHQKVDDGETHPLKMKRAAILVPDGRFEPATILDQFSSAGSSLPEDIRELVAEKIREYPVDKVSDD